MNLQAGFDEGYSLGATIGLRAGQLLGILEGVAEAAALVADFGVDGAMIATAAERTPSCFRPGGDGAEGPATWREMVDRYLRFAMETENRFGNTKFTLNHLIPGKEPVVRELAKCKSYLSICEALACETELGQKARAADEALALTPEAMAAAAAERERLAKEKREARKRKRTEDLVGQASVFVPSESLDMRQMKVPRPGGRETSGEGKTAHGTAGVIQTPHASVVAS